VFATCKFLRNERAQKAIIRKLIEPCRPLPVRVTPEEARNTNCRHWAPRKQFGSLSNGSSFRSTLPSSPLPPGQPAPSAGSSRQFAAPSNLAPPISVSPLPTFYFPKVPHLSPPPLPSVAAAFVPSCLAARSPPVSRRRRAGNPGKQTPARKS
jgi:hypothetical protein